MILYYCTLVASMLGYLARSHNSKAICFFDINLTALMSFFVLGILVAGAPTRPASWLQDFLVL